VTETSELTIRPYEQRDREAIRWLCCQTGFLGQPIDPVFEDRELFADFLTNYYTDHEPQSCFVVEHEGQVKGYLLGSRLPLRHQFFSMLTNIKLILKGIFRYPGYSRNSRKFVGWIVRNSWREVPAAPRKTAHFHFNILPEAQSISGTRVLLDHYFNYLRKCGDRAVFGQVVTFASRRPARVFERYGFEVINKSRITKFDEIQDRPVYLCTVLKKLDGDKPFQSTVGMSAAQG